MKQLKLFLAAVILTAVSSVSAQNIVITEISYNPPESGSDSTEFIELYNNGSTSVDMTGYTFTSGVIFTFPSFTLAPGAYVVVAVDSAAMNNVYGVSTFEWSTGGLSNGGEPIALKDINGNLIDSLRYDDNLPWPDGSATGAPADPDGSGPSIRLCDPSLDNSDGSNWSTSDEIVSGMIVNGNQVYGSPGSASTCNVSTPLTITTSINNNVSCLNGSDGSATGTAAGGTSPYTYNWSNGDTTATATGLFAGSYTVVVTDNNSSSASATVTITQPTALNATITGTQNVSCNGQATGSISAVATGGTSPYTYLWSNGGTTSTISSLVADTYSLTVTDANGCNSFNTGFVTQPSALNVNLVLTDVSVNGGSDGAASATISGGTPAYSYLWSTGATSTSISNLVSGSYALTINDANSCDSIISFVINQPTSINTSLVTNDVTCNGGSDGSATVSTSGGTSPYTYLWSNGLTSSNASGLTAGTYVVTVSDAAGATATDNAIINEPTALVASTVVDSNETALGNDGGATASATGGVGVYTYAWSNSSTTASITGLSAGTYSVTITDSNGCTDSSSVVISAPNPIVLSDVITNVSCNGFADGSILLTASNGVAPYSFVWSNGDTTSSTNGLSAGVYTVTVSDAAMITEVEIYTITEPSAITVNVLIDSNVSCFGGFDGGLSATAMGGVAPYNYSWSSGNAALADQSFESTTNDTWNYTANPSTYNTEGDSIVAGSDDVWAVIREFTGNIDSASNGIHFWGIQDINNSNGGGAFYHTLTFDPINVSNETGLTVRFDYYSVGFDGTDEIEYEVAFDNDTVWSAVGTALNKNTQAWTTVEIAVPDSANFVRLRLQANQNGGSDYAAFDNVSLVQSSSSITGIAAGSYSVTVTDANGCSTLSFGSVSEPMPLMDSIVVTNASAIGMSDGALDLTVFGGTSPYTYSWSNGVTTEDNINIAAGTYTVTITDANGCTIQDSESVQDPANIVLSVSSTDVTCNGGFDGTITINPIGGTMPYTYLWTPSPITGQGTNTVTNLGAGQYNVTVSDAVGTTASSMITVLEPTAIITSLAITNESAQGSFDGAITASVIGGIAPYTYNWSGGITGSSTVTGLTAGNYCVTITDVNGCSDVECGTVMAPGALASLVITEINYNGPESGTDTSEFIEFVNVGSAAVNLDGYTFTQGVTHTFGSNDVIAPGQYFVIAYDSSSFRNRYGFNADAVWTAGGLTNGGEDIIIVDNFGRSIDTVDYDDNAPWPAGFTAGGPDGGGASIELIDSTLNNNDGANWVASPTALTGTIVNGFQVYGTPGQGAILVGIEDNKIENQILSIYPNPTNGLITLELNGTSINERVQLIAIDGKVLRDEIIIQSKTQMDLSSYSNGIYFLRVGESIQKIVLNR